MLAELRRRLIAAELPAGPGAARGSDAAQHGQAATASNSSASSTPWRTFRQLASPRLSGMAIIVDKITYSCGCGAGLEHVPLECHNGLSHQLN